MGWRGAHQSPGSNVIISQLVGYVAFRPVVCDRFPGHQVTHYLADIVIC